MVVFLVPLKSPSVARSWRRTCQVFERSLRSICRQTSPDFRVVVICHDLPNVSFSHPAVRYIQVDGSPPANRREATLADRQRKELVGLLAIRELGPCHVMKVDADDCISARLAEFVSRHAPDDAWFMDRGYLYFEGLDLVRSKRWGFHRWCGSSTIVPSDRFDLVRSNADTIPADDASFQSFRARYYVAHHRIVDEMRRANRPMKPLPFAGAMYMLGHGENSGEFAPEHLFLSNRPLVRAVQSAIAMRRLSPALKADFGVYHLPREGGT
jgi:hypothetical protein